MELKGNKEYRMAVALLQFKAAYSELVAASKAMPDLDLSEHYPFYLLDFETIENGVIGWCSIHASKMLRGLPDRIDNPACLKCPGFRAGIKADGLCSASDIVKCGIYPMILFTKEAVAPHLIGCGYTLVDMDDAAIQLLYMKECDNVGERKKSFKAHKET